MSCLIGKLAPHFNVKAVEGDKMLDELSLSQFLGKYVVLFFYPLDFTFVCPTELHAFQAVLPEFQKRNATLIGCSVDSSYSHYAWLNCPKQKGGIQGVTYPIISDLNKEIAKKYQVLNEEEGIAFRGLFLIDQKGIIRHQLINDLSLGRSTSEILRLLDALIFHEQHGDVCPANWEKGDKGMQASQDGLVKYFN